MHWGDMQLDHVDVPVLLIGLFLVIGMLLTLHNWFARRSPHK